MKKQIIYDEIDEFDSDEENLEMEDYYSPERLGGITQEKILVTSFTTPSKKQNSVSNTPKKQISSESPTIQFSSLSIKTGIV